MSGWFFDPVEATVNVLDASISFAAILMGSRPFLC